MKCRFVRKIDMLMLVAAAMIFPGISPLASAQAGENDLKLHPKIQKLLGKSTSVKGPNCWNLALVAAGLLPSIRHTDSPEFRFYLNSKACRMLGNNEARKPGDLGAIRLVSPGGSVEYHGFVFMNLNQVLTKNGVRTADPYQIQSLDQVLATYNVPANEHCRHNELDLFSGCVYQLSVFRCTDRDSWLRALPPPDWAWRLRKAVDLVDKDLENALIIQRIDRQPLSDSTRRRLLEALEEFDKKFADFKNEGQVDFKDLEQFRWAQVTLASLVEQLGSFREGALAAAVSDVESRVWDFLHEEEVP